MNKNEFTIKSKTPVTKEFPVNSWMFGKIYFPWYNYGFVGIKLDSYKSYSNEINFKFWFDLNCVMWLQLMFSTTFVVIFY